jgi:ABC-type polysaccharide/polyol phosphate export permease
MDRYREKYSGPFWAVISVMALFVIFGVLGVLIENTGIGDRKKVEED